MSTEWPGVVVMRINPGDNILTCVRRHLIEPQNRLTRPVTYGPKARYRRAAGPRNGPGACAGELGCDGQKAIVRVGALPSFFDGLFCLALRPQSIRTLASAPTAPRARWSGRR